MSVPPARARTGPVRQPCQGLLGEPCTNTAPNPHTVEVAIDLDGNETRWLCATQCKSKVARRLAALKLQLETDAALERGFPAALLSHVTGVGGFKIVDTPCALVRILAANEGIDVNDRDAAARFVERIWNDSLCRNRGLAAHASIVRAQKVLEETGEYMCPYLNDNLERCGAHGCTFVPFRTGTFAGIRRVRLCENCHNAVRANPDRAPDTTALDKLFQGPNPPPRFREQWT